jgi:hypothetical protein
MRFCARCDNCRWDSPRACDCGAPGEPCPVCNSAAGELPEGFIVDVGPS